MQPDAFADFNSVLEDGGVDVLFCGVGVGAHRLAPSAARRAPCATCAARAHTARSTTQQLFYRTRLPLLSTLYPSPCSMSTTTIA